MILVGDSGGMVVLGYKDTVPVTMDEMIFLASAVRRGAPDKFIVGDMPKGSYEASNRDAVFNAMRFTKEAGCDAVKLEGGTNMAPRVRAIVDSGIPVIGHIGLTPQSAASFGGYRVVGRQVDELKLLQQSSRDLEVAGAFGVLLEATPPFASQAISELSNSIIFGIGAGAHVHGQLLILHDLLGLFKPFRPKFAKCYIPQVYKVFLGELEKQEDVVTFGRETRRDGLHELTKLAVQTFVEEVRAGRFPDDTFTYKD
jgi:3-methyl-2-oxobutanoate hydroxymethyltransferase